jgi:hypothetical protein
VVRPERGGGDAFPSGVLHVVHGQHRRALRWDPAAGPLDRVALPPGPVLGHVLAPPSR